MKNEVEFIGLRGGKGKFINKDEKRVTVWESLGINEL